MFFLFCILSYITLYSGCIYQIASLFVRFLLLLCCYETNSPKTSQRLPPIPLFVRGWVKNGIYPLINQLALQDRKDLQETNIFVELLNSDWLVQKTMAQSEPHLI